MTHLCDTCRDGLVIRRASGTKSTWCHSRGIDGLAMPNDVARCSDYDDKRFTAKWELEKIGWTLRTDKSGAAIGFARPKEK